MSLTVTVALQGGLFDTANEAVQRTERESIYDQIVGVIKSTDQGEVDLTSSYTAVEKTFEGKVTEITNESTIKQKVFTVEGNKGTYKYKITTTGVEAILE